MMKRALITLEQPLAAPIRLAFSYDEEIDCFGIHGSFRTLPPQRES